MEAKLLAVSTQQCTQKLKYSVVHMKLIYCYKPMLCVACACSVVSDSLRPHGLQPTRLLCPWDFSRQEYWSGLPLPSLGDLPDPRIEPKCPVSPALVCGFFTSEPPGKPMLLQFKK